MTTRAKNRREYNKAWWAARPLGYIAALSRRRREENPGMARADYLKHKAARDAYRNEWRRRNPDKVAASQKKRKEKRKQWLLDNTQRVRETGRRYKDSNRSKFIEYRHRRRNCAGPITDCVSAIERVRQSPFCHWCCRELNKINLTIDHVIPLSRGGLHAVHNLVAACRHCNSSKRNRLVSEWTWEAC